MLEALTIGLLELKTQGAKLSAHVSASADKPPTHTAPPGKRPPGRPPKPLDKDSYQLLCPECGSGTVQVSADQLRAAGIHYARDIPDAANTPCVECQRQPGLPIIDGVSSPTPKTKELVLAHIAGQQLVEDGGEDDQPVEATDAEAEAFARGLMEHP